MTAAIEPTPLSLLERLRDPAADSDAWRRFVHLYSPLLLAWSGRFRLTPADAADLVQDVFVQLVRALPTFRREPGGRFRSWLWTVLLNKHRENCRRRGLPVAGDVADLAGPDDVAASIEADYRRHLASRALALMRAEFAEPTWRACWATVVEGRPVADVACDLGVTPAAVYKSRARVLLRLRQELAGLLD